jgi:hypothetical protein
LSGTLPNLSSIEGYHPLLHRIAYQTSGTVPGLEDGNWREVSRALTELRVNALLSITRKKFFVTYLLFLSCWNFNLLALSFFYFLSSPPVLKTFSSFPLLTFLSSSLLSPHGP